MEQHPVQNLPALVPPLLDLCARAGELILGHYNAPGAERFRSKGDDSPLTHADLDAHRCLQQGLRALAPELPILSEESPPAEVVHRRQWREFWLVDPLDGTKEFLARTGEFTVNIALVRDHRPALGVLYVPLEHTAYVGIPGQWARRFRGPAWRGEAIATRALSPERAMVVLASRRHRGQRLADCLGFLEEQWGEIERDNSGSALKFCHLAEGRGDFYPRYSPCSEWDTAAGQALLEAAGGALVGLDGRPLRYNEREELLNPPFLAMGDPAHPFWRELLALSP